MKLNKKKIEYIVRKRKQEMSTYQISRNMNVSERRVNQILLEYNKTGILPEVGKKIGRPMKVLSEQEKDTITSCFNLYKLSASQLEHFINNKYGLSINHNKIHQVLLEKGFAKSIGMKIRKKNWIRYERKHSLSAVHMDWAYEPKTDTWIIAVIDDASRMILAYGEFENSTVDNTILVLKEALKYGKIREVITDHGAQFTANKLDKNGNASSQFAEFCKSNGIKQILCRVKHPQSNGKIERWFGLYRQKRDLFPSLKEFVYWYNHIKPHMSLKYEELETPAQAFERKFKK
jgi:putative transposase